jgi:hypothetical protein
MNDSFFSALGGLIVWGFCFVTWLFGVVCYARTENWWGAVIGFVVPPVGWVNGLLNYFA